MEKLLIIHTGGTISMVENKDTGEVNIDGEHPLTNIKNKINSNVHIEEKFLFDLPSTQITPQRMLKLSNFIKSEIDKYNGIIITHGTDTLEETAYFLDIVLNLDKPIIITGAMRASNEIGSDGLYNLMCSIRVAIHKDAKNKGVLVVMNDEIHTPDYVTKTSTSNVATFQSPQFGPIGIITKNEVIFYCERKDRNTLPVTNISHSVYLLKAYTGMDENFLKALHNLEPDGLVIEGFGSGNLPKEMIPFVKTLVNNGTPIVITSRSFTGHVQPVYGYEGGGKHLENLGVIFAGGLSAPKARIKLLVALEKTKDIEKLKKIFDLQ